MSTGTPPGRDEPGEAPGQPAHVTCSHCGRGFGFAEQRPLFCAFCGKPIPPAAEGAPPLAAGRGDAPTLATAELAAGRGDAPTLSPVHGPSKHPDPHPRTVGGYRLLRKLGGGGMGTVYEAEDPAGGRRVALKLIAPEQELSADSVERFRREGRLASALSHPRCVFVYAADEDAGRPYIVMELMPGETLADLVRQRGPLPPGEAVAKILDVLDGLREAHGLGVVHRDVKPSNCFLEADGRVKVGDFGLSKSLAGDTRVTGTGSFLGTPAYASPEQVRGEAAGPQSDVYSLAATLYCLLTGRSPFEGGDAVATLARIVSDPVPPLRSLRPGLPAALDRAVLRGLERDRRLRWRDLDAFREALVPFLLGRSDAAGPGARLAAFLADVALLTVLGVLLTLAIGWGTGKLLAGASPEMFEPSRVQLVTGLTLWLLYFGVPESLWGCTPGKRLVLLRVCTPGGTDPPPRGRELLRCVVFITLLFLGSLAISPWLSGLDYRAPENQMRVVAPGLAFYPLELFGIGLLLSTMRPRNGWRGLHEILSGTRVAQLSGSVRQRSHGTSRLDGNLSRPEGIPERVGPFEVRGALRWGGERVLLGEDPALGRQVLLWLRPAGGEALAPARRDCARPTRLRWLAAGEQAGWRWDAFPAPAGRPLSELVAEKGPLPRGEARLYLVQLAEELAAAAGEGTLPPSLAVGQVWVQPGGGVVLLDTPLRNEAGPGDEDAPTGEPLAFLAAVMVLALEGWTRPGARRVRAPVPVYAARLARRLVGGVNPFGDVEAFRAELAATRDRPAEVTRGRRAAQVAVMALALSFGLCCCVLPGGVLAGPTSFMNLQVLAVRHRQEARVLQELEAGAAGDFTAGVLAAPPLGRPVSYSRSVYQLREDRQLAEQSRAGLDRVERELQDRLEAMSWPNRLYFQWMERAAEGQPGGPLGRIDAGTPGADFRAAAKRLEENSDETVTSVFDFTTSVTALVPIAIWSLLWVVWALMWRGGLTYQLMGLSLVCWDGRPAGRLRCAYRASLVWVPVAALFMAAVALDAWHWGALPREARHAWLPWLTDSLRWAGVGLLVLYPVLALCYPVRAPHDRLAGTYLVPR